MVSQIQHTRFPRNILALLACLLISLYTRGAIAQTANEDAVDHSGNNPPVRADGQRRDTNNVTTVAADQQGSSIEADDEPPVVSFNSIPTAYTSKGGVIVPREDSVIPTGISAVINTTFNYNRSEFSENADQSILNEFIGNFEPIIRSDIFGGVVLQSEGLFIWRQEESSFDGFEESTSDVSFQRGFSTLTRDFQSSAIRLQLGDVFARPVNFQRSARILGINLSRDYQGIQPFRNVLPGRRRTFSIDRPSRVQVYADDVLVDQQVLQPGAFDVDDFANSLGTQRIELEIRDNSGRLERVRFSSLTLIPRLEKGVLDFGLVGGFLSQARLEGPEYDLHRPVFSAFAQYGLSSNLNAGVDFQADEDTQIIGSNVVLAGDFGALAIRGAVSRDNQYNVDYAAGVSYSSPLTANGAKVFLDFEYTRDQFASIQNTIGGTVGGFSGIGPPRYVASGSISKSLTNSFAASIGGDWRRYYFEDSASLGGLSQRWSAYIAADMRLSKNIAVTATFSGDQSNLRQQPEYSAFLSVRRHFGDKYSATVSYNSRSKSKAVTVSREPQAFNNVLYSQVRAEHIGADPSRYFLSAELDYTGNRFSAYGTHYEDRSSFQNTVDRNSYVQINTALAFADGAFAIGNQVRGRGFAIVENFKEKPKENVYIDYWAENDYRSRSGALGPALVSDILPYSNDTLEIIVKLPNKNGTEDGQGTTEDAALDAITIPDDAYLINVYGLPNGGVRIGPSCATGETESTELIGPDAGC